MEIFSWTKGEYNVIKGGENLDKKDSTSALLL